MTKRHAGQLHLGELVVADGLAEHLAVVGVGGGRFVGRLHHAEGPRRRLQPAVLEPLHLVVEAPPEPVLAADEVRRGHPPAVEGHLVGVHAAVADGVDGPALHRAPPPGPASSTKPWPSPRGLGTTNSDRPRWVLAAVGVGAGQQHEHVGAGAERAPRLHAVDDVAGLAARARSAGVAVTLMPATSEPKSGSVTATAAITSAVASLRQPLLLLGLGAALHERPGEDLGPGDERAADAERAA